MTAHDDIPQLDAKGLREFGLTTGAIIIGLFGLLLPLLLGHWPPRTWPWVLGTILILWALISPKTLNPVYHLWMKFGLFMGAINSKIILGVVFYVMIAPMGFIKRLFGSDSMQRQFNPSLSTYRVASKVRPKESMERPF